MKVQKLKISNIRCFENLEVDFDPDLTVIVGLNGSGKTTLLDAIVNASMLPIQTISGYFPNPGIFGTSDLAKGPDGRYATGGSSDIQWKGFNGETGAMFPSQYDDDEETLGSWSGNLTKDS